MLAATTTLPVIGVPVSATKLNGMDALLAIVQMPKGVPVATVAIDGARNAGLLAISMLSIHDDSLAEKLEAMKVDLAAHAAAQDAEHFGQ
jgi:5-(carboxyamino)imidazole ribonucleotide mutase